MSIYLAGEKKLYSVFVWRKKILYSIFVCSGDIQNISFQAWLSLWKWSFGKRRKLQYPYISWIIGLSIKKWDWHCFQIRDCMQEWAQLCSKYICTVSCEWFFLGRTGIHLPCVPCSTAVTWRQQQLQKLSQNTKKRDKIWTSSSNWSGLIQHSPQWNTRRGKLW